MKAGALTMAAMCCFAAVSAASVTIVNNCESLTIWPGYYGKPDLESSGNELPSKNSSHVHVPRPWVGRFWARTGCKQEDDRFLCITGDCGQKVGPACNGAAGVQPATLVEFDLGKGCCQDSYNISTVSGFNLPVQVTPIHGKGVNCKQISCPNDINQGCPSELAVKDGDRNVGCKSPCAALGDDKYCCTGWNDKPETCLPTEYSKFFKTKCPQAFSYRYDRSTIPSACLGAPDYEIKFCP